MHDNSVRFYPEGFVSLDLRLISGLGKISIMLRSLPPSIWIREFHLRICFLSLSRFTTIVRFSKFTMHLCLSSSSSKQSTRPTLSHTHLYLPVWVPTAYQFGHILNETFSTLKVTYCHNQLFQ